MRDVKASEQCLYKQTMPSALAHGPHKTNWISNCAKLANKVSPAELARHLAHAARTGEAAAAATAAAEETMARRHTKPRPAWTCMRI